MAWPKGVPGPRLGKFNLDRIWDKIAIPPNVLTDCWLWTGGTNFGGYGRISHGRRSRALLVHRLTYEMFRGPIPDGLIVRHVACARPTCVNPFHLEPGTHLDNGKDKVNDGHSLKGTKNANAKINDDSVRLAREMKATGSRLEEIACRLGISRSTAYQIVSGRTWRHV